MIQVTTYNEKPTEIYFENFGGTAANKVWIRKNIKQQTVQPEQSDPYKVWVADEVYFETAHTLDEIKVDTDAYWQYGQTWQPGVQDEGIMDNKELTEGYNNLQSGQLDLYDAIAALYETANL